ncbi:hypothetical protein Hanom_Chr09g00770891 [Helianthus anomalus]
MANYANTILGDDGEDDIDFDVNPTREEPILLSSGESDDASFHLIRRSSRASLQRGPSEELAADDVDTLVVDPQVGTAEQVETRKKKRGDKTEEKKVEEPVAETPRKRPSNSSYLDYVVVSDTLSGLDAGEKKKELDVQAAAALAEKKSKFQKETVAPSDSEIDLGLFSEKTGNRLEKIFKSASGSRAPKSGRSVRKIDISKITLSTSPPSKPLDLSPTRSDPKEKGKEDDVEEEIHAEGVETEVESSEATPQGIIYTKRVRGYEGSGASDTHQSPEYHRVQGGSWTTHVTPQPMAETSGCGTKRSGCSKVSMTLNISI